MKKFAIALLLFSATGISAGIVSLDNDLSVDKNTAWEIACYVKYKDGKTNTIMIKQGERIALGETASIAEIHTSTNKRNYSFIGRLSPIILAAETVKGWDNLTSVFSKVIKGHENDNFIITVDWKDPNSHSYGWLYTFTNLQHSLDVFKIGSESL